jgi:predicted nucleotidyltransferase
MNNSQFGFKEGDLEIILTQVAKFPDIEKCIIYGSRAKGNSQQGSDVDIAIVSNDKSIAPEISSLLNEESPLPYTFDVIDFNTITYQDLTVQINRSGIIIYDRNSQFATHD